MTLRKIDPTNSKVLSKQPRMLWHWHAIQVGFSGWKVDERLVFSWTLLGLSHRTTSPGSVVATLLLVQIFIWGIQSCWVATTWCSVPIQEFIFDLNAWVSFGLLQFPKIKMPQNEPHPFSITIQTKIHFANPPAKKRDLGTLFQQCISTKTQFEVNREVVLADRLTLLDRPTHAAPEFGSGLSLLAYAGTRVKFWSKLLYFGKALLSKVFKIPPHWPL